MSILSEEEDDNEFNKYFQKCEKMSETTPVIKAKKMISEWRDVLKDQINNLLYIEHKLKNEYYEKQITKTSLEQFERIFKKLRELSLKEIEIISEAIYNFDLMISKDESMANLKIPDDIYEQLSIIREKYNQIITNIKETIMSLPSLLKYTFDYFNIEKKEFDEQENNRLIKENKLKNLKNKKSLLIFDNDSDNSEKEDNKENCEEDESSENSVDMNKEDKNNNEENKKEEDDDYYKEKPTEYDDTMIKNIKEKDKMLFIKSNKRHFLSQDELLLEFKKNLEMYNYQTDAENQEYLQKFLDKNNPLFKSIVDPNNPSPNNDNNENNENSNNLADIYNEISSINNIVNNLKNKVVMNCKTNQEKKTLEKMKNDNIELNKMIDKIKKYILIVKQQYKYLIQKITLLEEEQIMLTNQNRELISYIKGRFLNINNNNYNSENSHDYTSNNILNISKYSNASNKFYPNLTSLNSQCNSSTDLLVYNINNNLEKVNN